MKHARITAGLLVAAALLLPAAASAATSADLQSETIAVLQQIVLLQQRIIAALQTEVAQLQGEVNSLSGGVSYSQFWPIEQALGATSTTSPSPAPTESAPIMTAGSTATPSTTGASCVSADGVRVPSGQTVLPDQGLGGHMMTVYLTCRDGQWYFNGIPVIARPLIGQGYTIITK